MKKISLKRFSLPLTVAAVSMTGFGSANASTLIPGDVVSRFNISTALQVNGACFFGAGVNDCVDNGGLELITGETAGGIVQGPNTQLGADVLFAPTIPLGDEMVDADNRVLDVTVGVDAQPGDLGVATTTAGNTGVFSNFGAGVMGQIRNFDGDDPEDLGEVNSKAFGVDDPNFVRFEEPGTGNIFVFSFEDANNIRFNFGDDLGAQPPGQPLGDYNLEGEGKLAIYDSTGELLDWGDAVFQTTGQFLVDDVPLNDLVTGIVSASWSFEVTRKDVPEPSSILGLGVLSGIALFSTKKKLNKNGR